MLKYMLGKDVLEKVWVKPKYVNELIEIGGAHAWFHIFLLHHFQCDMGLVAIFTS